MFPAQECHWHLHFIRVRHLRLRHHRRINITAAAIIPPIIAPMVLFMRSFTSNVPLCQISCEHSMVSETNNPTRTAYISLYLLAISPTRQPIGTKGEYSDNSPSSHRHHGSTYIPQAILCVSNPHLMTHLRQPYPTHLQTRWHRALDAPIRTPAFWIIPQRGYKEA